MPNELDKLLEASRKVTMTAAEAEEQRRSFAYGNTKIENDRITRATVDEQAEALELNERK
jgi:hypothetical protein